MRQVSAAPWMRNTEWLEKDERLHAWDGHSENLNHKKAIKVSISILIPAPPKSDTISPVTSQNDNT